MKFSWRGNFLIACVIIALSAHNYTSSHPSWAALHVMRTARVAPLANQGAPNAWLLPWTKRPKGSNSRVLCLWSSHAIIVKYLVQCLCACAPAVISNSPMMSFEESFYLAKSNPSWCLCASNWIMFSCYLLAIAHSEIVFFLDFWHQFAASDQQRL